MDETSGQKCSSCQATIEPGQTSNLCPRCGTIYHADCWNGMNFCLKCGWPVNAPVGQASGFQKNNTYNNYPKNNYQYGKKDYFLSYDRVPFETRVVAAIIDFFVGRGAALVLGLLMLLMVPFADSSSPPTVLIVVFFTLIFPASIWGFVYSLIADGFKGGQSVGKKTMGLMVVYLPANEPCSKSLSAARAVLWMIPYANLLIYIADFILIMTDPRGRRLGDALANTQVIWHAQYQPNKL